VGYDPSLGFCEKKYLGSKEKQGMFSFNMKVVNKKCLSLFQAQALETHQF
jgi:hypothetical protein